MPSGGEGPARVGTVDRDRPAWTTSSAEVEQVAQKAAAAAATSLATPVAVIPAVIRVVVRPRIAALARPGRVIVGSLCVDQRSSPGSSLLAVVIAPGRPFSALGRRGPRQRTRRAPWASQSTISQQLRILRDRAIVERRREGRLTYYRLADGSLRRVLCGSRDVAGDLATFLAECTGTRREPADG